MPSQPKRWIAIGAALIAFGGACSARPCDSYGIEECDNDSDPLLTWRTVGSVTDTCDNPIFLVFGEGSLSGYPDIEVSQEADCTWNLVIKTRNTGLNSYSVRAMQPNVRFHLIRLEKAVGQSDHHVNFSIGGEYPVESVRILGPFDEDGGAVSTGVTVSLTGANVGIDISGDVDVPCLGLVKVRDVQNLQLGGDVGYTDEIKTSSIVAEHINILEIEGDLIAQMSVTEADVNGVSISSLVIEGRMGLEDPEGTLEEETGDLRTEGTIRLLTVSEVGPKVDIGVGELSTAGFAAIEQFVVTTENSGTGDFYGTLTASTIFDSWGIGTTEHQITILGDMYGKFEFDDAVADYDDDIAAIVVDGAFKSGARINLPANGLEGQIIFNRANDDAAWQSNAKVVVGTTELDTTQYGPTAASIGGGAAGRAEYRLHSTSCDPAEVWSGDPPTREPGVLEVEGHLELDIDGTTWVCVVDEATVFIQFYGPVSISTEEEAPDRPVKVHKWDGDSWDPITAFSVSEAAGGDQKRLAITLANDPVGGSYRVTREPGGLLSNQVDEVSPGTPAGVNAFTFYFDVVGGTCESMLLGGFDLNSDQSVSQSGDMPAWLVGPVDYNDDAATDSADVQLLQSAAAMYGALPVAPAYFPGPFVDVE